MTFLRTSNGADKKIVILGGGFGGLAALLYLKNRGNRNFSAVLIDKNNCHLYYPNIYEIATALLSGEKTADFRSIIKTVCFPFKEIIKDDGRIKIITEEAVKISLNQSEIILKSGTTIKYDYLILALGSETNYFGVEGAKEYSLEFKSLHNGLNIRNKIEEILRQKRGRQLKIAIAGGGFSGCELAAELSFFIKKFSWRNFGANQKTEISIIEATPTILSYAGEKTKKLAMQRLKKIGVELKLNSPVKKVENGSLVIGKEKLEKLDYDILIWTAGIAPSQLLKNIEGAELKKGCLLVNNYLQIGYLKNVFAVGDNGFCPDKNGQKLPATAYYAVDQGKIAAQNIINQIKNRPLKSYRPRKPIFSIPLGSKYAITDLGFITITGFLGWLIRHLITLKYFLEIFSPLKALKLWIFSLWIFIKND